MYREIWKNASKSIAHLSFFTSTNIKIDSLTGFKYNDYIITDSYLNRICNYDTVQINFIGKDGQKVTAQKTFSKYDSR